MTMMFLAIPAIRVALSVPLDLRSNWVFRMTEDVAGRAEVAAANVRIVLALGVAVPLALLGPVQWWVLGPSAAGIIALEALIGWLVVEWVMADWRRIPFTCSYIPGKGFVPHMFVKGFASYLVFTTWTTLILRVSLASSASGARRCADCRRRGGRAQPASDAPGPAHPSDVRRRAADRRQSSAPECGLIARNASDDKAQPVNTTAIHEKQ